MSFFVELWDSVFTPGTTPALITATHASFILLILSLTSLIYLSGSIHFVNLLVISCLLYGAVIWFIHELEQAKIKSNDELNKEAEGEEKADNESETTPQSEKEDKPKGGNESSNSTVSSASAPEGQAPRKRKV